MKTERLFSLDLLRGLDMFVLVALTHVVWAAHDAWGLPQAFVHQFTHPWGGFTFNALDISSLSWSIPLIARPSIRSSESMYFSRNASFAEESANGFLIYFAFIAIA